MRKSFDLSYFLIAAAWRFGHHHPNALGPFGQQWRFAAGFEAGINVPASFDLRQPCCQGRPTTLSSLPAWLTMNSSGNWPQTPNQPTTAKVIMRQKAPRIIGYDSECVGRLQKKEALELSRMNWTSGYVSVLDGRMSWQSGGNVKQVSIGWPQGKLHWTAEQDFITVFELQLHCRGGWDVN